MRFDVRAGVEIAGGVGVRLGVLNLANEQYATHLNSLNPYYLRRESFTRERVAEMGRSFYVGVEYGF